MHMMGHKSTAMTLDTYNEPISEHLVKITRDVQVFGNVFLRKSLRIKGDNKTEIIIFKELMF
jgi:hypothetical protein